MSPFRPDALRDTVALITGGGSGICLGIAKEMGAHGARLMIMGRRADVLEAAAADLRKQGIDCHTFAGDVRDFAAAEAAVKATVERFGKLNLLLNGAAGNFLCPTEKLSSNGFKTVIDIDLLGTFNMSRAAFDALKAARSSLILNISATLHYQGTLMQAHVMAAKAGIDALGRNLAAEWGEYGIRVCTIAPGPIADTEGVRRLMPLGADEKVLEGIPLRRMGRIADIAQTAVFLASSAAAYITGEVIAVDGGQWLSKPPLVPRAVWEQMAAAPKKG